ncbi:hypothetical protein [Cognatishimia sp. MH4019]|uniref:hypothetical protein n=1 Tax=Cognatishimia sp. MH4019 TaxID=2854030 RepID=UPI001CD66C57|nr:hypothetical protein [Cognatishimia sp. MH4019]
MTRDRFDELAEIARENDRAAVWGATLHPALIERINVAGRAKVFECPRWPDCGCPDGTIAPDCPGKTRETK